MRVGAETIWTKGLFQSFIHIVWGRFSKSISSQILSFMLIRKNAQDADCAPSHALWATSGKEKEECQSGRLTRNVSLVSPACIIVLQTQFHGDGLPKEKDSIIMGRKKVKECL